MKTVRVLNTGKRMFQHLRKPDGGTFDFEIGETAELEVDYAKALSGKYPKDLRILDDIEEKKPAPRKKAASNKSSGEEEE